MKISNTALASFRYDISPAATSAIVSAFLQDLIKSNYLTSKMANLACDPKKIWRARQEVMTKTRISSEKRITEEPIKGIFVDGRKDPTLTLVEDSITKTFCRRIEKQENIIVSSEPDGSYLTHYTPSKGPNKPAKEAAIGLYNWMVPRKID